MRGEVQEKEDTDVARVSSNEEVIGDFDEGSLSAVVCSETRLKGFVELIVGHVLMELGGNCSFHLSLFGRAKISEIKNKV